MLHILNNLVRLGLKITVDPVPPFLQRDRWDLLRHLFLAHRSNLYRLATLWVPEFLEYL